MSLNTFTPFFDSMAELAASSDPDVVAAHKADVLASFEEAGVDLTDPAGLELILIGANVLLGFIELCDDVQGGAAILGVGLHDVFQVAVTLSDLTEEVVLP